jgi:putative membrane protein
MLKIASILLVGGLLVACNTGDPDSSFTEEGFITEALKDNSIDIAWLNAGITMGTDTDLVSNAHSMLEEHDKLGQEMTNYAIKNNIKLPDTSIVNVTDKGEKTGKDWDLNWSRKMIEEYERLIEKFSEKKHKIKDKVLKKFITKTIPIFRSHLQIAKQLDQKLNP